MALSNLVVERIEQFGGIDLKRNYRKYFSNSLGISIGLHLLVVGVFSMWTMLSDDGVAKHVTPIRVSVYIDPPLSVEENPRITIPITPTSASMLKPNLGIPVPVPDAIAVQPTLPNLKDVPIATPIDNAVRGFVKQGNPSLSLVEKDTEPDPNFVPFLTEEPEPIIPIEKLLIYPEVARRSGLQGKVVLQTLLSKDGSVLKVRVLQSDYDMFKQTAVEAMLKAKFTPARQDGKPLSVWITRTITFKLTK